MTLAACGVGHEHINRPSHAARAGLSSVRYRLYGGAPDAPAGLAGRSRDRAPDAEPGLMMMIFVPGSIPSCWAMPRQPVAQERNGAALQTWGGQLPLERKPPAPCPTRGCTLTACDGSCPRARRTHSVTPAPCHLARGAQLGLGHGRPLAAALALPGALSRVEGVKQPLVALVVVARPAP